MSHPRRRSVGELESIQGPSLWVSEEAGNRNPEPAERARFIFERTASGLTRVAIRGFNDGQPMDAIADSDANAVVRVLGRLYTAVEADRPVHELPLDQEDEYLSAIYDDVPRNLLVEALDQEEAGLFFFTPGSGPNRDRTGQLIVESPKRAAICYDFFNPAAEFLPIVIEREGPLHHIVSITDGWLETYNSMVERTSYFPTDVVRERDADDPAFVEDLAFLDQLHKAG